MKTNRLNAIVEEEKCLVTKNIIIPIGDWQNCKTVPEDIVLTPELIDYIKDMQDDDNAQIESQREFIADVICMLGKTLNDYCDNDYDKSYAAEMICCLSHMRDRFKKLMKP